MLKFIKKRLDESWPEGLYYVIDSSSPGTGTWDWTAQFFINMSYRSNLDYWTFRHSPFVGYEGRRAHNYWVSNLKVGDIVCDCAYRHGPLTEIDRKDDYCMVLTDDGPRGCSLSQCIEPADHGVEEHPVWDRDENSEIVFRSHEV